MKFRNVEYEDESHRNLKSKPIISNKASNIGMRSNGKISKWHITDIKRSVLITFPKPCLIDVSIDGVVGAVSHKGPPITCHNWYENETKSWHCTSKIRNICKMDINALPIKHRTV